MPELININDHKIARLANCFLYRKKSLVKKDSVDLEKTFKRTDLKMFNFFEDNVYYPGIVLNPQEKEFKDARRALLLGPGGTPYFKKTVAPAIEPRKFRTKPNTPFQVIVGPIPAPPVTGRTEIPPDTTTPVFPIGHPVTPPIESGNGNPAGPAAPPIAPTPVEPPKPVNISVVETKVHPSDNDSSLQNTAVIVSGIIVLLLGIGWGIYGVQQYRKNIE
jgi:hypothetical protein